MILTVLSLCSGVGGLDRGLEDAGMSVIAHCEIDPHARSVLARHWPDVPCHDDITTFDGSRWHGRANLVAGGTPCTDLSVAGRRAGLVGDESRLFWDFCRIADRSAADWVLWENVAGALSSNDGEDFAAVLWGFTGYRPAVPSDGWRTIGVCQGPRRTAVWRLLDAQWFGVAQRRRRVFVVAGPRNLCSLKVLVESESLPGGARPGSPTREDVAGTLGGGSGGRGWCPDTDRMTFVPALTARYGKGPDSDASDALMVSENQRGEVLLTPYARQLTTGGGKPGQGYPAVLAMDWTQNGAVPQVDVSPTLRRGSGIGLESAPMVAYPLAMRGREDGAELELGEPDVYNSLRAGDGGSSRQNGVLIERWVGGVQQDEFVTPDGYVGALAHASNHHTGHHQPKLLTPDLTVRRLTPRECERLMGWPDDWTRYTADGTEIADSHRYRMCGNGVVSPVAEWIGHRIIEAAA